MVAELMTIPLPRDDDGHIQPTLISMLPEAKVRFIEFVNEHGEQTNSIENTALRYHYAKLESVAARLALIFYLCDGATEQLATDRGIEARHVLAGIALARWFGREAARVYDSYESDTEREKRDLLDSIKANGGTISLTEMRSLK